MKRHAWAISREKNEIGSKSFLTLSVHLKSPTKKRSSVVWTMSCLLRREERYCFASAEEVGDDGDASECLGSGVDTLIV